MRLWTREWAGWFLIALALFVFFRCYVLFTADVHHYVIEGCTLAVVGIILFRGGIHLVKVAIAARICLQAQESLKLTQASSAAPAVPSPSAGRGTSRAPQGSR